MLYSVGPTSRRSLEEYEGPVVETSEDWVNLSRLERKQFAKKMDLQGAVELFLKKKASTPAPTESSMVECFKCCGSGELEGHARKVGIFSPSQITRCIRAHYFQYMGEPGIPRHSSQLQLTFDIGTALHEWFQERYFAKMFITPTERDLHGCPDVAFEAEVESMHPELEIYGHADGILIGEGFRVGVELKTISTGGFAKLNKPNRDYLMQNTCYNMMNNWPGTIFLFIEKDQPHRLKQFFFGYDPDMATEIVEKIELIKQAAQAGEPPEPDVNLRWACRECRFHHLCRFGGGEV